MKSYALLTLMPTYVEGQYSTQIIGTIQAADVTAAATIVSSSITGTMQVGESVLRILKETQEGRVPIWALQEVKPITARPSEMGIWVFFDLPDDTPRKDKLKVGRAAYQFLRARTRLYLHQIRVCRLCEEADFIVRPVDSPNIRQYADPEKLILVGNLDTARTDLPKALAVLETRFPNELMGQ